MLKLLCFWDLIHPFRKSYLDSKYSVTSQFPHRCTLALIQFDSQGIKHNQLRYPSVPLPFAWTPIALTRTPAPLTWTQLARSLTRHNRLVRLSPINVIPNAVLWRLHRLSPLEILILLVGSRREKWLWMGWHLMRGFRAEHAKGEVVDQDTDCDYEDDEDLYLIR